VTCPVCGSGNPHEAQFCSSCGVPLGSQGTIVPPEASAGKLVARDTSELVRETFRVYRTGFRSFLLIALIAVASLIPLVLVYQDDFSAIKILAIALSLILVPLAKGAMVCAVSQSYLERPIKIDRCFGRAWARVLSLVLSTGAFVLALIGAAVTVIGVPLAIYLVIVWFYSWETIMIERKGPLTSLWHSRELVKGRFWKIVTIRLVFELVVIAGLVPAYIILILLYAASPVVGNLASIAVITALMPIMWIGATLAYYDLRIRKDNYTIENLAQEMGEA
jgi:hypothetical protein